jgi:hypothetical protein
VRASGRWRCGDIYVCDPDAYSIDLSVSSGSYEKSIMTAEACEVLLRILSATMKLSLAHEAPPDNGGTDLQMTKSFPATPKTIQMRDVRLSYALLMLILLTY